MDGEYELFNPCTMEPVTELVIVLPEVCHVGIGAGRVEGHVAWVVYTLSY